jgi:hypothetical protein
MVSHIAHHLKPSERNKPMRATEGDFVTPANIPAAMDTQWVLGFLTAFNFYGNGSGNITNGTDANGVFAWIDTYCAAHPLDQISTATVALVAELSKRGSIKRPKLLPCVDSHHHGRLRS